jgi:thiosulfate/3-mercaptopyruvate sulfurtransferase
MASSLISPEELLESLGTQTLLDVRWQLGRTDGPEHHTAGHIPGAAYVDLPTDLADPPGRGGRHPLPDPERFAAGMRRCGVSADRPVVVYDATSGQAAARAWWLLRHHGHPDVRLLDGGWQWWLRVGGPVESGPVVPVPGDFHPGPGRMPVVDASGAASLAADGVLYDARAPERYRGDVEPVDPVAGRVPGALNVPTARNLVEEGERAGRFRDPAELASVYGDALRPGTSAAAYCGSGVTAAHDVLALDLLGVSAALYPGSWSEWVTDPSRAVERG